MCYTYLSQIQLFIPMNNSEEERKLETINFFMEEVLVEMKQINKSSTKKDLLAYVAAWENTLLTIKFMIN